MPRFHFSVSQRYALALISMLVLMLTAAGGIFWYSRAMANASYGPAGAPTAATADASADDTQSGTGILLGLARDARWPPGGTRGQQCLRVLPQRAAAGAAESDRAAGAARILPARRGGDRTHHQHERPGRGAPRNRSAARVRQQQLHPRPARRQALGGAQYRDEAA